MNDQATLDSTEQAEEVLHNPAASAIPAPPRGVKKRPPGFLPFDTNWFDRFFVATIVMIALHLLWLRFFEPAPLNLPLWICTIISVALGILIFLRG